MRWTVHGERSLYESEWLRVVLVDVEIPGGERFDHHVVRMPNQAAGTIVRDPDRGVLLLWRHRFITDTWGWEIPIGRAEPGENLATAAAREVEEETGWRPGPLTPLLRVEPTPGISTSVHHVYWGSAATRIGAPADDFESSRIEWVPLHTIPGLIHAGEI